MNTKQVYAIGLMSGTSLDGLDLVYVKFTQKRFYQFEILCQETIKYSHDWSQQLKNAIELKQEELDELDKAYGVYLGKQVNRFIESHRIEKVDFIASHGHTVFHQPEKGITKQIGDGQELANIIKIKVVCDFRTQDVQYGGQGAPLVPVGDQLLFSNYDACVNLGGFANISFEKENRRIAYDICPVNVLLNHFSQKMGYEFDSGGEISAQGAIDKRILDQLNSLDYYSILPPKSLGIEWANKWVFPIMSKIENLKDILRTYTEHAAFQIVKNIQGCEKVLFTGGGVFNTFLMDRINALSSSEIIIPDEKLIDYKEALIFAFLGLLKLEDKINCLSSVTGAKQNHSSGKIFTPN